MTDGEQLTQVSDPTASSPFGPANGSASSSQTTDRLFREAMKAVDTLSEHLKAIGEHDRMYKVNAAWHRLWEAQ
jgi:hypothetical protein